MSSSSDSSRTLIAAAIREQRRRNRFGEGACELCGDSLLVHLNRWRNSTCCACCLALLRGRDIFELHHVAGRGEGPTVHVCCNCHAELSELQRDWPPGLDFAQRLELGLRDLRTVRARKEQK